MCKRETVSEVPKVWQAIRWICEGHDQEKTVGAADAGKIFHDLGQPRTGDDARKGEMILVPLKYGILRWGVVWIPVGDSLWLGRDEVELGQNFDQLKNNIAARYNHILLALHQTNHSALAQRFLISFSLGSMRNQAIIPNSEP